MPTVIVAAITGRINKAKIPTHVEIEKKKYKLDKDFSYIIRTNSYT